MFDKIVVTVLVQQLIDPLLNGELEITKFKCDPGPKGSCDPQLELHFKSCRGVGSDWWQESLILSLARGVASLVVQPKSSIQQSNGAGTVCCYQQNGCVVTLAY